MRDLSIWLLSPISCSFYLWCDGVQLQSKFQNQVNHLIPGYRIIVILIELLEYIAAEIESLLMQQALCQGNKLTSGNYAVLIVVKDIK